MRTLFNMLRQSPITFPVAPGFVGSAKNFSTRDSIHLNMPQMALCGLSESWLLKEMGNLHWKLICDGLGTQSHNLATGRGHRLYATFTRIQYRVSKPLASFAENDLLELKTGISRYGAGLFFSRTRGLCNSKTIQGQAMSSFTRREASVGNSALSRGQPEIPAGCPIMEEAAMPEFGVDYKTRKKRITAAPLFECAYDILPCHDINGVGLLYFAAYPSISDICEIQYMGQGNAWATQASVIARDIHYYANCDISDRIVYRVHDRQDIGNRIIIESSLSRERDDRMMAYLITEKELKLNR